MVVAKTLVGAIFIMASHIYIDANFTELILLMTMVTVNRPEPSKVTGKGHSGKMGNNSLLMMLAAAAVFTTLVSIFGPTLYLVEHQHAAYSISFETVSLEPKPMIRANSSNIPPPSVPEDPNENFVEVEDLLHEDWFTDTIKSCVPGDTKKCKEFIPDPIDKAKKVQRVALVAPPGDISGSLLNRLEQVMLQHNHRSKKEHLLDIDVVETTHVPPYGYGKTHGWTKIIRLVPQPLTLEVTDALQNVLEPGESHRNITLLDLKAGMRQILRFHCRLSHVAAHTATLSIPFMDLLDDPMEITKTIQSFLAPGDNLQGKAVDDDTITESIADDDQAGLFDSEESYGTQMLSYVQSISGVNVDDVLDKVLMEEMKKTNNMTQWPCPSFWAAGDEPEPLKLSPIVQRLAKALSPDCSAPFTSCFVARDKCEEKGDGLCKGNK